MDDLNKFDTLYGRHGFQFNVRETYAHLPFQAFWTWVTGKGLPQPKKKALKLLKRPGPTFLFLHLLFTWSLLIACFVVGYFALNVIENRFAQVSLIALCWLITVNRFRSLQATFHYLSHRSIVENISLAKIASCVFITTPLLYISWHSYCESHVRIHHNLKVLCGPDDPDQKFILRHRFRLGMPEWEFWLRTWLTPFHPRYLSDMVRDLFSNNFVGPQLGEIIYRTLFITGVVSLTLYFNVLTEFLMLFVFPRLVLFEHSMWLQVLTEHLWLYERNTALTDKQNYGRVTWGRFQGRPPEFTSFSRSLSWLLKIILYDIPVRLYVYPQDLPNHDFHHRLPRAPYRAIGDTRASMEGKESLYGPMYEVWGFYSTLLLLRDHFCNGVRDSFIKKLTLSKPIKETTQ
ncbi:hypothetical protein [Teredinibacter purpureus]|uniref:hypothetical protein n=1 Tax=Teredinibacter purpureus TaxID=2731756 RepID=UPI0005F7D5A9|nr:hypothetical protein [Teredinibacter purpureus]